MQLGDVILTRYKNHLLVLFLLCEIVFGVIFFAMPAVSNLREVNSRQYELSEKARMLRNKLDELGNLQSRVQTISAADIEKLRGFFVDPPEIAYVATAIDKYATASRLFLSSFSLSEPPSGVETVGPLREIQLQAQFKSGSYRGLKEFLRFMTLSVPFFEVSAFTFEPRSATASVNFKVYAPNRTGQGTFDFEIFEDSRFKELLQPAQLPKVEPVGKSNPFSPPADTVLQ